MTMNVELVNRVADEIEKHPDLFAQYLVGSGDPRHCGSPRCVGGWSLALSGSDSENLVVAAELLGLPQSEPTFPLYYDDATPPLFAEEWPVWWYAKASVPSDDYVNYSPPTAREAVAVLRAMAADGEFWTETE